MENETAPEATTPETKPTNELVRKGLILVGATVGMIIAGGFAFAKKSSNTDTPQEDVDRVESEAAQYYSPTTDPS